MKIRPLLFIFAVSTLTATLPALAQTSATPPATSAAPAAVPVPGAPAVAGTPPAPPAPPAVVYKEGVIKVGNDLKQTLGTVTDVDKGDNGCYLTLKNEKNIEFIEVGTFALCTQKPPIKGKRVEMTYSMETIQAADCYGDPKCKRTETVPVITAVQISE